MWKPRKSQFSAQSSHPVSICALQLFQNPPLTGLSRYTSSYTVTYFVGCGGDELFTVEMNF